MRRLMAGVVVLLLAGGLARGESAAEAVDKLRDDLIKEFRAAKTQKDRTEVMEKYAPRFLDLAKKNAKDESAFDALIWVLQLNGDSKVAKDSPADKALAILEKDYLTDKRAAQLVSATSQTPATAEKFAKAIMAKNPDRKVQAKAAKALVRVYEQQAMVAERLESNERFREAIEKSRGKDYVKNLLDSAPKNKKSAEEYSKLLTTKYAGVFPDLSVGKKAPEVVSKDLDGKEVKLSQYRGKVVVLDVWATWCGPCVAMIPHERELVKKLAGKPFALISISADAKKATLTEFLKEKPMPWVHWHNGQTGGILEDWEIDSFPTIYVLDHKGVIRYKNVRGKAMDEAVEKLLEEIENAKKVSSR